MFGAFGGDRSREPGIEVGLFVGNPVFNDASGTRVSAIRWGSRIFLALVVLLAVALALTLRSHVSIPGLERLGTTLDAREVRPVMRTGPSSPPVEQARVATDPDTFRAQPSPRPTTGRAGVPSTDAASPAEALRAGGPTTGSPTRPTTAERSTAPEVKPTEPPPTGSAGPMAESSTVTVGGRGAEKSRNPKAATPSPLKQQPPGQTRRAKPKPNTDIG
jgi:hypothetical protein